jgi:DNA gyrase/topoisomerase IV subunit B
MNIGHRIFIVEEDAILPLSQKAFNALHSGKAGILPKYAGQTILIAMALYTLQDRKPKTIIQVDYERIRILGDGSIDMEHEQDGLHLAANRISLPV